MRKGRPSTFDKAKAQEICAKLRLGHFLTHAAALVRVPERTVHHWLSQGRKATSGPLHDFALDVDYARADFVDHALIPIRRGGKNAKDLQWLLSKLQPKTHGDRIAVHLEEGISEIVEALRAGLEPEAFERVVEVLGAEVGIQAPAEAASESTTH